MAPPDPFPALVTFSLLAWLSLGALLLAWLDWRIAVTIMLAPTLLCCAALASLALRDFMQ